MLHVGMFLILCMGDAQAASGLLIGPADLPPNTLETLREQVAAARAEDARPFELVSNTLAQTAAIDRAGTIKTGPGRSGCPNLAPYSFSYAAIPSGTMAMLEVVALEAPALGDLPVSAELGVRAGLLEAIGKARDPRSEGVLHAVLDSDVDRCHVLRSAAVALGRLGSETAIAHLTRLADEAGATREAAIEGLGHSRRVVAAAWLADELSKANSREDAEQLIRALGDVGNSYAWKTPQISASGEGDQVRQMAAEALVKAFVRWDGATRLSATKAVMVVDDPDTSKLIDVALQSAEGPLRIELEALAASFENNPVRRD